MKVLVCGGREYTDYVFLNKRLSLLNLSEDYGPITQIIHGGARGADTMAGDWAEDRGIKTRVFLANWDLYGKPAGMIRNQQMLDIGEPDYVVAFPGGKGTEGMINIAKKAGVPVIQGAIV